MNPKNYFTQIFIIVIGLLLLGGLGAYWPILVGADTLKSPLGPQAIIADAIAYQGYLTDENDVPLNGTFSMRFEIYNDPTAGDLLWDSGLNDIAVFDGIFVAQLEIDTDIFNGEELWVAQTVEGELLAPRHEILPVPLAHTLRPGAVVKGTASAITNNYLLEVDMNNDVFGFNRGAIAARSTTGNAVYSLAQNGRAIYGQTQDGYAVYGFDGGSNANSGYAGYFYSTNGIGVYGYSNGNRAHPNIFAPGVYGQSNQGVGVYGRGDTSDGFTFYNEGGYFEGGKGLYARGQDPAGDLGYGARFFSDNYRGIYARGDSGYFDAYFGGDSGISTNGIVNRASSVQSLVVNLGDTTIEPGDLVAMAGITPSPENDQQMLGVTKLEPNNRKAVIGVASQAVSAEIVNMVDSQEYIDFAPVSGSIGPADYLIIITDGLAPAVNLSSLGLLAGGEIGDKITLAGNGQMSLASNETESTIIGKIAGPVDPAKKTIPLFIDID